MKTAASLFFSAALCSLLGLMSCGNDTEKAGNKVPVAGGPTVPDCSFDFISNFKDVSGRYEVGGGIDNEEIKSMNKKCLQFFDKWGTDYECMAQTKEKDDLDYKLEKVGSKDLMELCTLVKKAFAQLK